ncbi:unnamed protein product [Meloidogyne enterolobii]|uniref:Uncharacterized protein n=1 Tax=Meloidogyne enterolobii TaxID=390850 RepID=A0ACB0XUQ6_MELEN
MRIMKMGRDATTYSLLDVEKSHLEETISKIEKLDLEWNKHMSKLHGLKKLAEEDLYRDFPSNEPSYEFMPDFLLSQQDFVTQCKFARQMAVSIGIMLENLGPPTKDSSDPSEMNKSSDNCTDDLGGQNGKTLEPPTARLPDNPSPTPQPPMVNKNRVVEQNRCLECSLCRGNHLPSHCTQYSNPKARKYKLLEQHRCLNCLRDDHLTFECQNNRRCSRCRGKHHFMVCYSRGPKTQILEPMRKSDAHCSKPVGMFEVKKMLDEKTKALQEKDKTIVKLMSELMLARKKAEDESKKAKRLKRLLDESNQRIVDDHGKRILKETRVNALQKANRKLIARNGKLKREVHAYHKKCQREKLEPPDFYAFCRSWIDMKMSVLVLAAFVMILDGTKNVLMIIIHATNKLWKCKTNEKMEEELTLETPSWLSLTLFAAAVAINSFWTFLAIFTNVMDGWAHAWKESRKCAMDDVPKIKKRKKILERWKKEIEDETFRRGRECREATKDEENKINIFL